MTPLNDTPFDPVLFFYLKLFYLWSPFCGSSSPGRATASQAVGSGFESRLPLKIRPGGWQFSRHPPGLILYTSRLPFLQVIIQLAQCKCIPDTYTFFRLLDAGAFDLRVVLKEQDPVVGCSFIKYLLLFT